MKATNKQIIAIIYNQQEAGVTEEMYSAVRANEYLAWENTRGEIKGSQNNWSKKNWTAYCREMKKLIAND